MELSAIGRELRARRTAAGRTVASVAADAGLSVPYIANLENGRGNPTVTALTQLAEALGMRLEVALAPAGERPAGGGGAAGATGAAGAAGESPAEAAGIPPALVRLGRTARFRRTVTAGAAAAGADEREFARRLVSALAALGQALDRDLAEADWWRLLDALLLVAAHPA